MPRSSGAGRHHQSHRKWPKKSKETASVRAMLKEFRDERVAAKKKYGKRVKPAEISKQAFERESKRKGCRYVGEDEGGYTYACKDKYLYADVVNKTYYRRKISAAERRKSARLDRMYGG